MTAITPDEPENQPSGWLKKIVRQSRKFNSSKNTAKLTRNYFDSLEAQFKSLSSTFRLSGTEAAYANAEAILDKYKEPNSSPSWGDLMQLDLSIIQLLTDYHLQLKVAELRQRVSAIPYAGRVEVLMPPDELKVHENLLRAEAIQLATRLWQVRKARHERERQLKTLITNQANVAIGILSVVFALVFIDRYCKHSGFSFLPVLFGFGVAGAFMSILRRLQQAISNDSEPDISKDLSVLENEKLWISLVTGGIFSILLYFLFSSGVGENFISDTLIPTFHCNAKGGCSTLLGDSFLTVNLPVTVRDFAKCIVWSFLAGFSEQLVPDVLDRLSKQRK